MVNSSHGRIPGAGRTHLYTGTGKLLSTLGQQWMLALVKIGVLLLKYLSTHCSKGGRRAKPAIRAKGFMSKDIRWLCYWPYRNEIERVYMQNLVSWCFCTIILRQSLLCGGKLPGLLHCRRNRSRFDTMDRKLLPFPQHWRNPLPSY